MKGLGMNIPEARRRFAALVDHDQEGFRLAEAALLIAQEEYATLDVTAYLTRINSIADTIKAQLALELDPMRIVQGINTQLFDELGFRGNQEQYNDPRNSFLNDVIERRLGIPITLSVLYIEIGRLVGLPIAGVGLPGHFIIKYTAQPEPFWIDPFNRGTVMTREDCQQLLQQFYGEKLPWNEAFLDPVSDHNILQRMLNNLKIIYARQGEHRRALSVIERILVLSPDLPYEIRDRGLVHYQLGHLQAALHDLQRYLELFQEAPDAVTITRHIDALRQQLEP
jgi:regulator of sirC expression with transglutaminase-like and TPR domain